MNAKELTVVVAAQTAEIAELKARLEVLEAIKVEDLVQAALVTACAVDRVDHAVHQAQREDRARERPIRKVEPISRPGELYTAWQCDARALKLRARGFEDIALAYKAGGFVKARLADGTVHDTTVQRVGEYLAGRVESPF